MATRRERVVLSMGDEDSLSGRMRAAALAAEQVNREWALRDATWEPHDWREFQ